MKENAFLGNTFNKTIGNLIHSLSFSFVAEFCICFSAFLSFKYAKVVRVLTMFLIMLVSRVRPLIYFSHVIRRHPLDYFCCSRSQNNFGCFPPYLETATVSLNSIKHPLILADLKCIWFEPSQYSKTTLIVGAPY